jgi:hypothetical protein
MAISMSQTSTKRRNILKVAIITAIIIVSSFGALFYLLTYDNVKVSGEAVVSGAVVLAANIKTIEFTDTQTGITTSSHFTFPLQSTNLGNYSVILKNGHTYNVYINFSVMSKTEKEFITSFTVNAVAGQKEITKDFLWPNPPGRD